MSVLDVGTFDGFYAFLAESRGATRVVAIDNEQYRDWVRARWGAELVGGEGFRAIAALLGSRVSYRRLDAFDLDQLGERFDVILCFGILHRVEHPLGLLKALRQRLGDGGEVLVETYRVARPQLEGEAAIHICEPGEVYARDDFVYWAFTGEGLGRLARIAGFARSRFSASRRSTATRGSSPRFPERAATRPALKAEARALAAGPYHSGRETLLEVAIAGARATATGPAERPLPRFLASSAP